MYGDIWAGPYLELEPGLVSVIVDEEGVAGYVLGALDTTAFSARLDEEWWPAVRAKYADLKALADAEADTSADHAEPADDSDQSPAEPDPKPSSTLAPKDAALLRAIYSPLPELEELVERYPSHLHIDLLPRVQRGGWGTILIEQLISDLREAGSPGVHLIASATNLSACTFYRRMGFTSEPTPDGGGVVFMMQLRP